MNEVIWKDIVKINGEYILEECKISFLNPILDNIDFPNTEEEILNKLEDYLNGVEDTLYDCNDFFNYISAKYKVNEDDVETFLFSGFRIPDEVIKEKHFDISTLGGYINGIEI